MLTAIIILLLILSVLVYTIFPILSFYFEIAINIFLVLLLITNISNRIMKKKFRMKSFGDPIQFSLYIGMFQIILLSSFGFIVGFGKSPYSHTPIMLLINAIFVFSLIISREFSRAYLLHKFRKFKSIVFVIATFYTILSLIPTSYYLKMRTLEILKYVGSSVIPTFTQQLFATILAYYSGAYASSTYFAVVMGFDWFSPILPKLDWMLKSFINTLVPVIGYLIMSNEITIKRIKITTKENKNEVVSWIITLSICMLILLFFTGNLGYHPAVVGSGSMAPTICTGDIVIVKKVNISNIHIGDIIQYRSKNGITITHRVINIKRTHNGLIFITKGDANNVADEPFKANRVIGKVVFIIPKVGLIPLMIRNLIWKMMRGG